MWFYAAQKQPGADMNDKYRFFALLTQTFVCGIGVVTIGAAGWREFISIIEYQLRWYLFNIGYNKQKFWNSISNEISQLNISGPMREIHQWPFNFPHMIPLTKGHLCGKRFHVPPSSRAKLRLFIPYFPCQDGNISCICGVKFEH